MKDNDLDSGLFFYLFRVGTHIEERATTIWNWIHEANSVEKCSK